MNGMGPKEFIEWALQQETDECILWPFNTSMGYGDFHIDGQRFKTHRFIALRKHGPPPPGRNDAAHHCGVSLCVNHRHIRWATRSENLQDMVAHGTAGVSRGTKQGHARLTEDHVHWIRRQHILGFLSPDIARRINMSPRAVRAVARGENWGWLPIQDPYIKKWADLDETEE